MNRREFTKLALLAGIFPVINTETSAKEEKQNTDNEPSGILNYVGKEGEDFIYRGKLISANDHPALNYAILVDSIVQDRYYLSLTTVSNHNKIGFAEITHTNGSLYAKVTAFKHLNNVFPKRLEICTMFTEDTKKLKAIYLLGGK